MKKVLFTIDGFKYPHIGFTSGKRWNGWATPYFEIDEAIQVMQEYNEGREEAEQMTYDKETDTFSVKEMGGFDGDEWKGTNYPTDEGIKHLYGIGAYSWVWELTTDDDLRSVAQNIEDFLYELDTYEFKDQYADREEVVEEIIKQLQDFNTLKQVLIALYGEELTEEELAERLGKELKI